MKAVLPGDDLSRSIRLSTWILHAMVMPPSTAIVWPVV